MRKGAMMKEMSSLHKNNTWELIVYVYCKCIITFLHLSCNQSCTIFCLNVLFCRFVL